MSLAHMSYIWLLMLGSGNSRRVAKNMSNNKDLIDKLSLFFLFNKRTGMHFIYILWKPKEQYIQKINTWNKLVSYKIYSWTIYSPKIASLYIYERLLPEGEVLRSYEWGETRPLKAESNFRASSVSNRKKQDVLIIQPFPFPLYEGSAFAEPNWKTMSIYCFFW